MSAAVGLSAGDVAFVRAFAAGAETFQPDPTTEPYDAAGLRVAVEEIAAEVGVTVDELVAAAGRAGRTSSAYHLTITEDPKVAVQVLMNYGDGDHLAASFATGAQAGYPEAVVQQRAECDRMVDEYVRKYRDRFPGLTVTDHRQVTS